MTSTSPLASLAELDALTRSVLDHGIDADCSGLVALARAARSAGLSETLIGVLLDADEPAATRERAFAALARKLERSWESWTHVPSQRSPAAMDDGVRSLRESVLRNVLPQTR
jgi:hypothetical protein